MIWADFAFWLRDIEVIKPPDDKKALSNAMSNEKKAPDTPAAADKTVQPKGASPPAAKP